MAMPKEALVKETLPRLAKSARKSNETKIAEVWGDFNHPSQ